MSSRIAGRLDDISRSIAEVKALLAGRSRDFLAQDRVARLRVLCIEGEPR